ncbi:dihydroneopterin aldolase [Candidatus Williamhamiltonella defendens]|uniref:7,8-dihydroneopterin aldolase n=1 Tax=Candidatus Hamiltonella defensa (Bemisia tabaci) TaxID=672795 RepID=A0A249DYT3_9ENTR|nr:dihydroneopterin aldolase [Candidatus Hamiltonella defensa]ASX26435.1 dihydroneopterin aldolase [Candidatus Hamiltonella defensa (Bemisia tabaci)]CED78989.1 Dihydroneopterin aldolase [Candidatus Hamiltonella defensa (Bemisia tabaci)]
MDILFIEALRIFTLIGVHDWEKTLRQELIFDIKMRYENRKPASSDQVEDCLNYVDICDSVQQHVTKQRFELIERVAEEVADLLLQRFSSPWVWIKVSKPRAVSSAGNVGVIIERSKLATSSDFIRPYEIHMR